MANRKKVILHKRDGWGNDYKLSLTQEQIKLLDWLLDADVVSADEYDLQVLDDADNWEEI